MQIISLVLEDAHAVKGVKTGRVHGKCSKNPTLKLNDIEEITQVRMCEVLGFLI